MANNKKIKTESPERSRRIVVAMSGGVDSSVAAALLKNAACLPAGRGFDVVGIFMKFWRSPELVEGKDNDNRCCSVESEKLARLVAKKLGIPFYVLNVEKEFKKKVVNYFLKEYKKGNTPNPCVVCNKEIKFGFLINKALSLGADYVATGHYARQQSFASARRQRQLAQSSAKFRFAEPCILPAGYASDLLPRSMKLFKGADKNKDQTYFLCQLNQKQLKHIIFPVGQYTKPQVRKLAKKFMLPTAETPESQEVCFIQNTTNEFLKKYLKTKPGPIIEQAQNGVNKIIGQHQGLWFYTIGQRKGLEISQGPWFVVEKDFKKNILVVSKNVKDLGKKELVAVDVNWINPVKLPINAEVKIRYKAEPAKAKIIEHGKGVKIIFVKHQRAITPGQSAVFYQGDELLGGGIIK
ncbi:MAG: tRNA 2-thiouridine(34) synthase MnmA [Candidatus Staskawiczbacteria bacterium]|nr:tRNA 2-thiouridine(34) synthase MnmA [Candidatus Staskawiczbacteria bacterium]